MTPAPEGSASDAHRSRAPEPAPSAPTVARLLAEAARALAGAGIDTAALDAGLLLAEALGVERLQVYADPHRIPTAEQIARFDRMLARRLAREPVAYILGRKEFFGLVFEVTRDVLIPRPETELLVQEVVAWLRERDATRPECPPPLLADIGTGSGAIAVAAAFVAPRSRWIAVDRSAEALAVARRNAQRHGVGDRIEFRCGSLVEPIAELLDAIAANLPYVADADREALAPEVVQYEPPQALFSGAEGLAWIERLIRAAPERLRPGGLLALECGVGQARRIVERLADDGRYAPARVQRDLAGIERVVLAERT